MRPPHGDEDLTRLLALSDGLFAIVLTLLVLDLQPADPSTPITYAGLVSLWPRLFGFLLTFMVGGSYWVQHHADFDCIVGYDRTLLWLNLMFLLAVSLLPFTTGLIRDHANTLAWILYALNVISIGLCLTAVWGYASAVGLTGADALTAKQRRIATWQHFVTPIVFVISIPVALLWGLGPYTLLLIPVGHRVFARVFGDAPTSSRPPRGRRWLALGYLPVVVFAGWSIWLVLRGEI